MSSLINVLYTIKDIFTVWTSLFFIRLVITLLFSVQREFHIEFNGFVIIFLLGSLLDSPGSWCLPAGSCWAPWGPILNGKGGSASGLLKSLV